VQALVDLEEGEIEAEDLLLIIQELQELLGKVILEELERIQLLIMVQVVAEVLVDLVVMDQVLPVETEELVAHLVYVVIPFSMLEVVVGVRGEEELGDLVDQV